MVGEIHLMVNHHRNCTSACLIAAIIDVSRRLLLREGIFFTFQERRESGNATSNAVTWNVQHSNRPISILSQRYDWWSQIGHRELVSLISVPSTTMLVNFEPGSRSLRKDPGMQLGRVLEIRIRDKSKIEIKSTDN